MKNGKLALRLCLILVVMFILSASISLVLRNWLDEWAIAPAMVFAAVVGPLAGRLFFNTCSTESTENLDDSNRQVEDS